MVDHLPCNRVCDRLNRSGIFTSRRWNRLQRLGGRFAAF
jgi:hypothetical protein